MDKELKILLHEKAWDRAADLKHISDYVNRHDRAYINVRGYLNMCYQEICEELKSRFTHHVYLSCAFCFHNENVFCDNCKNDLSCNSILYGFSEIFDVLTSKNFFEIPEELIKKHETYEALEKVCEAAKKMPIPEHKELNQLKATFSDDLPF